MGSIPVFTKDPYAPGTLDRAASQVDRLIGSAYEVVREVAENLEYVKHVSSHLVQIYRVYQSVDGLDQIAIHLPELIAIYENLEAILEHGPSAVIVSDTAPLPPLLQGHLWWNSVNGNLYTWYSDVNSSQWVEIGGGGGGSSARIIISDNAPTVDVLAGQLWWSSFTGSLYIWYEDGDSGQWVQINTNTGIVNANPELISSPEDFGAKGDGATIDDAALTAWVNACNAAGITATTRAGAKYRVSSTLSLTLRVPFKGAPGSEFLVPNDGQRNPIFYIESVATDIEVPSLASVNTWTGLYKGSRRIPELTQREWVYSFYSTDAQVLPRSAGLGPYVGESFCVVDNEGRLDAPLYTAYSLPFTNLFINRYKLRYVMEIEGLVIRVVSGSSHTMNRCVTTIRPNTVMRNCSIFNDSGQEVEQGFVATMTMYVTYENCRVNGMTMSTTNYGFNNGYSGNITYNDCSETDCRRGIDCNGKNFKVVNGNYPDGVGGHWCDGLHVSGAILGFHGALNPRCIMVSGANVLVENCQMHIGAKGNALRRREDVPELAGYCIIRGGSIIIDDTGDTIVPSGDITLMDLMQYASYDTIRPVIQPSYVEFTPDIIKQIGITSTNRIILVAYGAAKTAIDFPQNIIAEGRMIVKPGRIDLEAGELLTDGNPRLIVTMYKGETQIGNGMDVEISNIQSLNAFCAPVTAAVAGSLGRFHIKIFDATRATSLFSLRYGSCKRARLIRCNTASFLERGNIAQSLRDEVIDFEDFGVADDGLLVNPFGLILQRGAITNSVDGTYGSDGWVSLAETGTVSVGTAGDVTGLNVPDNIPGMCQYTNPDVTPQRVGGVTFVNLTSTQSRISRAVTLVAAFRTSVPMGVRYAIGEWTGTPNFPTRDIVNNWSSASYTPGGFFIPNTTNILATGLVYSETPATNPTYTIFHSTHIGATAQHIWVAYWSDLPMAQNVWFRVAGDLYTGFERGLLRRRTGNEEKMRCYERFKSIPMTISTEPRYVSLFPPMLKAPIVTSTAGTVSNVTVDGFDIVHTVSANVVISIDSDI